MLDTHCCVPNCLERTLCSGRYAFRLQRPFPQFSHLAPSPWHADVSHLRRHDDGGTQYHCRRMGENHPYG